MPNVIADITMSLDGYVTGPGADEQHGLGDAPELHTWVMEQDAVDTEILEGATAASSLQFIKATETFLPSMSDPEFPAGAHDLGQADLLVAVDQNLQDRGVGPRW